MSPCRLAKTFWIRIAGFVFLLVFLMTPVGIANEKEPEEQNSAATETTDFSDDVIERWERMRDLLLTCLEMRSKLGPQIRKLQEKFDMIGQDEE